jgi:hypothetical protein
MHPKFADAANSLHTSFEKLLAQPAWRHGGSWPKEKIRGVYLFSENTQHLYVGRTNNVKNRYAGHCRPSSGHNSAPFAFRLAREATGRLKASYKTGSDSRASLEIDPLFSEEFTNAKARLRSMEFRWVEEADPIRQCLLEVYCAVVLETPYNDFDNH